MQKLIKINTDHYIIVDDSEIREGDSFYSVRNLIEKAIINYPSGEHIGKITHSTQPIEFAWAQEGRDIVSKKVYIKVDPLSLQEVKELIGEVDVEKKAKENYIEPLNKQGEKRAQLVGNGGLFGFNKFKKAFKKGYNQALEDNKDKKWTDEDMKECVMSILRDLNTHNEIDKPVNFVWTDSFKKHIQTLQLKTEWEVEIVDGKLKLK